MIEPDLSTALLHDFVSAPKSWRNPKSEIRNPKFERGYALVALLVVMSLLALFALAAAPQVQQQAQREREREAIFRGEQVADAIKVYCESRSGGKGRCNINGLPTSIDQLLEGAQVPGRTKKLQILRPEAAHDPLSKSGEWRLIGPTSQDFAQFVAALAIYTGGTLPPPKLNGIPFPRPTNLLDTKSTSRAPGGDDDSASSSGPFIGVASRSRRNSVITYYDIDRHDQWIFTPMFK